MEKSTKKTRNLKQGKVYGKGVGHERDALPLLSEDITIDPDVQEYQDNNEEFDNIVAGINMDRTNDKIRGIYDPYEDNSIIEDIKCEEGPITPFDLSDLDQKLPPTALRHPNSRINANRVTPLNFETEGERRQNAEDFLRGEQIIRRYESDIHRRRKREEADLQDDLDDAILSDYANNLKGKKKTKKSKNSDKDTVKSTSTSFKSSIKDVPVMRGGIVQNLKPAKRPQDYYFPRNTEERRELKQHVRDLVLERMIKKKIAREEREIIAQMKADEIAQKLEEQLERTLGI